MSGSHRPRKRLVRSSVVVPSPHRGEPETGPIKNPVQTAGLSGSRVAAVLARASISGPQVGTFFRRQSCARTRDHARMMLAGDLNVNLRNTVRWVRKKAGPKRARLKVLAT